MLESRVARIERLLAEQAGALAGACSSPSTDRLSASDMSHSAGSEDAASIHAFDGKLASFVAPEFWTALSKEVSGLRETLEDSDDQDGHENDTDHLMEQVPEPSQISSRAGTILFRCFHSRDQKHIALPSSDARTRLLQLYRLRVDTVYKVLHWPTVLATIDATHESPMAGSPRESQPVQILQWSIYFMAMCSITNEEAKEMDLGDRPSVLQNYRVTVEGLLAKSNLLRTPNLIILQAFVIYLVSNLSIAKKLADERMRLACGPVLMVLRLGP